ncbi:hypothetical protein [Mycobacterium tuberculosis]|uniref:hypothetical protein n=1 Tax=Mycobacterium tuberculosis TaxID=1773 RepID=UPI002711E34E|nr:hypothetical protein [Mycobacterium tuberculosis]
MLLTDGNRARRRWQRRQRQQPQFRLLPRTGGTGGAAGDGGQGGQGGAGGDGGNGANGNNRSSGSFLAPAAPAGRPAMADKVSRNFADGKTAGAVTKQLQSGQALDVRSEALSFRANNCCCRATSPTAKPQAR